MKVKAKRSAQSAFQAVIAVFMMLAVMLTGFMPVTVWAEASDTEKAYAAVYDYDYYKSHNTDLQKVFGNERQSYIDHFVKYGMKEGRQGNEEFNLEVYKYNGADLRAVYKDDNAAYYMHYIKYGKAEGRNAKTKEPKKASTVYNGTDYAVVYNYEYYRTNNTDLQKAFGEDSAKYLEHFVKHGMKEGRQGSDEFNLEVYKYNGKDLCRAYGTDNVAYYMHYIKYGKAEGRNARTKENVPASTVYDGVDYAAVYNYEYYRTNNTDLQKVFGEDSAKYLEHFVKYGMKEGRQGSDEFILDVYKSNYSDLTAVFGTDNVAYYMHYIKYGKAEGRNAKTLIAQVEGDYIITIDANGGYLSGDPSKKMAVCGGKFDYSLQTLLKNVLVGEAAENSDKHLVFDGWYYDKALTERVGILSGQYPNKDVTIYAKWSEGYTITFDANGGKLRYSTGDIQQYKCKKGASFFRIVEAWNEDPHKMFEGWYLDKEKTQSFELDYYGNFVPQSDMTIYAGWKDCVAVSFDPNGGYCVNYDQKTDLYISKTEAGSTLSDVPYPMTDDIVKTFEGWYLDKECTKPAGDMSTVKIDKDFTVYANWEVTNLKLTADACGGYFICDGGEIKEQREFGIRKGSGSWELFTYTPKNVDKHKIFDEWYLDKEYTQRWSVSYEFTKDTTVYARWKDVFVVTFDANGGYFTDSDEKPVLTMQESTEADQAPYCSQTPQIKNTNKMFGGWYLDKECTTPLDTSEYRVNSDVTLYAKWVDCYNITFDGNGGAFSLREPITRKIFVKVIPGNAIGTVEDPCDTDLIEKKYVFDGWALDAAGTISVENVAQYVPTADTIFYAKWYKLINVTFDANGGYFYSNKRNIENTSSFTRNQTISDHSVTPNALSENQAFAGWYFDKECTKPVDYTFVPTADIRVYAKWNESVTITINANGGKFADWIEGYTHIDDQNVTRKVAKGTALREIPTPHEPQDTDLQLWGWYLDQACTEKIEDISSYAPTHDVTIYAKWAPAPVLTFDANGGYLMWEEGPTTLSYPVRLNQPIGDAYEMVLGGAAKAGAVFAGWYFDQACTQKAENIPAYVITGDVTFYAKWEAEPETQVQISKENETVDFVEISDSEAETEVITEEMAEETVEETTEEATEEATETENQVEDESEEVVTESETEFTQESACETAQAEQEVVTEE